MRVTSPLRVATLLSFSLLLVASSFLAGCGSQTDSGADPLTNPDYQKAAERTQVQTGSPFSKAPGTDGGNYPGMSNMPAGTTMPQAQGVSQDLYKQGGTPSK